MHLPSTPHQAATTVQHTAQGMRCFLPDPPPAAVPGYHLPPSRLSPHEMPMAPKLRAHLAEAHEPVKAARPAALRQCALNGLHGALPALVAPAPLRVAVGIPPAGGSEGWRGRDERHLAG